VKRRQRRVRTNANIRHGLVLGNAGLDSAQEWGVIVVKGHMHDPATTVAQRIRAALDPQYRRPEAETDPALVAKVAAEMGVPVAPPKLCRVTGCGEEVGRKAALFCCGHFFALPQYFKDGLRKRWIRRDYYLKIADKAALWLENNRAAVIRSLAWYRRHVKDAEP